MQDIIYTLDSLKTLRNIIGIELTYFRDYKTTVQRDDVRVIRFIA